MLVTIVIFIIGLMFLSLVFHIAGWIFKICMYPLRIIWGVIAGVFNIIWLVLKKTWDVVRDLYIDYCDWYDEHFSYRNNAHAF